MARENNLVRLKRRLISELTSLSFEGRLSRDEIDGASYEITSMRLETISAVIHHDRAHLRTQAPESARFPNRGASVMPNDHSRRGHAQEVLKKQKAGQVLPFQS
jgi:hypothetical protein